MPTYRYSAVSQAGKTVKGHIDAESPLQARQILREMKMRPLEVHSTANRLSKFTLGYRAMAQPRVPAKHLALATQQLGTMLSAGIPLGQALQFVASRSPDTISTVFYSIRSSIIEGESLARSMANFPGIFNGMYLTSVAAGERAGALDSVLTSLADFLLSSHANRQKVKSALLYPAILLFASLCVVTLLMTNVMPGFVDIFQQNEQQLPPFTRFVIGIFEFVRHYWGGIFLALLFIVLLSRRLLAAASVKAWVDCHILRVPLIGPFIQNRATENLSRTLHILCSSGVQLLEALRIATNVIANSTIREQIRSVTQFVEQGTSFSQALVDASSVSPVLIQFVESGEASGRLDEMLKRTADILEDESNSALATLAGLAEPLILIAVSAIVFGIVIAILQPIFQLNSFV